MRKISANLVFDGNQFLQNTLIIVNDDGRIVDLAQLSASEVHSIEYYNGILMPGFINMHQHSELAWMFGRIKKGNKLSDFISGLIEIKKNNPPIDFKLQAMKTLDSIMFKQGVSCVVDIANTNLSIDMKTLSKIKYFTIIELYDKMGESVQDVFHYGMNLYNEFISKKLLSYISPHAFYSVSKQLIDLIINTNNDFFSIHFLESIDEFDLLIHNIGDLKTLSYNNYDKDFKLNGFNLHLNKIKEISEFRKIILVHNTVLTEEILSFFTEKQFENIIFCICPNSNLFISGLLPDFSLFERYNLSYCIGTDSLASNSSTSFIDELMTIQSHYKDFDMLKMLRACTSVPASLLGIDDEYGYLKKGMTPGIVLLNNVDTINLRFNSNTSSIRLL